MIPENRRQWVNSCRKIERMLFGLMNIWLIVIVIVQAWFWWVSSEWLEEREIEGETGHLKCATNTWRKRKPNYHHLEQREGFTKIRMASAPRIWQLLGFLIDYCQHKNTTKILNGAKNRNKTNHFYSIL